MLAKYRSDDGKPTAGMRIHLPDYLQSTHKTLIDVGFDLRRKHGNTLRKYVKFDDQIADLYLEVKIPGTFSWLRIDPAQAKQMKEKTNRRRVSTLLWEGNENPEEQTEPTNPNLIPIGEPRRTSSHSTMATRSDNVPQEHHEKTTGGLIKAPKPVFRPGSIESGSEEDDQLIHDASTPRRPVQPPRTSPGDLFGSSPHTAPEDTLFWKPTPKSNDRGGEEARKTQTWKPRQQAEQKK